VKLVHLTDTHICADPEACHRGVHLRRSFETVLAQVLREEAEAVVITGDLAMDGSEEAYRYLEERLRDLSCPVVACLGNHDDRARARVLGDLLAEELALGAWQLVLLDSNLPVYGAGEWNGHVAPQEFHRLRTAPGENIVLCLHHNPVADPARGIEHGISNAEEFMAALSPRVKLVLCGHVHQAYEAGRVLVSPTTNFQSLTREGAESGEEPGYRVVDLSQDGTYVSAVRRVRAQV
jgi:3',5'-cyclic-AMP phosphodiesterase